MNIIVCIKQVPDTTVVKIDPVKGTLIREGVPSIMNPDDKGGLELALRLKDQFGAHVTVISMGPPQADVMLREAYAMGADRAILLSDRKFAGADTLATSYALSGLCRVLDYDLIIAGRQAIDGDTAQVGPEIAEWLGVPQVTYGLEIEATEDGFKVRKEAEDGVQIIGVKTPCLITFTKPSFDPRYPTIKRKLMANKAKFETLGDDFDPTMDASHYGLNGSPTHVKKSFTPPVKSGGMKIKEETGEESAKKLAKILVDANIV